MRAPQAAAALEQHYNAESKGGAPAPHGLLPKQHVEGEVKRLAGLRMKLVKQIRVPRWLAVGVAALQSSRTPSSTPSPAHGSSKHW